MNRDQVSGALLLVFSLFVIYQASQVEGSTGTTGAGAGLFPMLLGISLAALSIVLLVKATLEGAPNWRAILPSGQGRRNVGIIAAGMIAYGLLLEPLGYVITSIVVCSITLRLIDPRRRLLVTVGVPTLATLFCYGLLAIALKVQLPSGVLALLGLDF